MTKEQLKNLTSEQFNELLENAKKGNNVAQNDIGNCYYYGYCVGNDLKKAAKWYKKSADQGNAEAQNSLANCYNNGCGVEKDYLQTVYWYKKAAQQGHPEAKKMIEIINNLDGNK